MSPWIDEADALLTTLEASEPPDLASQAAELARLWSDRTRLPHRTRVELECVILEGLGTLPRARQAQAVEALAAALAAGDPEDQVAGPGFREAWRLFHGQGVAA